MLQLLADVSLAPVTIDAAKATAAITVGKGRTIAFQVVASSASTPTGTTLQIQGSLDGTNWFNDGSAVSVTGDGALGISKDTLPWLYYRLSYTRSSGSYVATTRYVIKGDSI